VSIGEADATAHGTHTVHALREDGWLDGRAENGRWCGWFDEMRKLT